MNGLCQCGCGNPAPLAKVNHARLGYVKGQPMKFILGHSTRGKKMSTETRERMSEAVKKRWQDPKQREKLATASKATLPRGDRHHNWKGDKVGYAALHQWVYANKERTGVCEHCGLQPESGTDFANISGEYCRDTEDFIELCRPCHRRFDSENKTTPRRRQLA